MFQFFARPIPTLAPAWCLWLLLQTPLTAADPLQHQWCVYRTTHIEVTTDLPKKETQTLIEFLEHNNAVVRSGLLPYLGMPRQIARLLVFAKHSDFTKTTKTRFYAGYTQPSLTETRIVLGPNQGKDGLITTGLHEYTHFLMRSRPRYYPIWFEEGYASYLSSVAFQSDGVYLGNTPENRGFAIPQKAIPSVRNLLETRSISHLSKRSVMRFYAGAWLLTHLLNTGYVIGLDHRQHLADYLALLNQGVPVPRAFEQAFQTRFSTLDTQLRHYNRLHKLPRRRLQIALSPIPDPHENCLTEDQISLRIAAAVSYRNPAYAEKLYRNFLASNPGDIAAMTGLSTALAEQQNLPEAARVALKAYDNGDERSISAVQLANMIMRKCRDEDDKICASRWREALKLYQEALAIDPDRMDAIYGIGVGRLYQGLPGEALNYFRVAYKEAPWSPILNYYLGQSYASIGRYSRARIHLERAANWAVVPFVKKAATHELTQLPD